MSERVHPGGSRRANGLGSIRVKRLASGEARYETRYRMRYLGSFETRAEAQRALDAAILTDFEDRAIAAEMAHDAAHDRRTP